MPFIRSFILLILIACFGHAVQAQDVERLAQTIKGQVFKEGTDSTIAHASVYYDGSMLGTQTDKDGKFELRAKSDQIPVVVSCIGYHSVKAKYIPGKPLIIYLSPKIEQLRTVTIRFGKNNIEAKDGADGMKRKKKLEIFIKEFLGTSAFAGRCTITNIDDIKLSYDKKKDLLTAECAEPIEIENKALGYTIIYYLDAFARTPSKTAFAGNYIMRDQLPTDTVILVNRERAYVGSRMHFIRSLWRGALPQNGFSIYNYNGVVQKLNGNDIVVRDSINQKYIKVDKNIMVTNSKMPKVLTELSMSAEHAFIDHNGYYGPGVQWAGGIADQRIGDLLPFEYLSSADKIVPPNPAVIAK